MISFPVDKFATAVSMEKKFEYINASFVVWEVAISRKTANEKTIDSDSANDLARSKIRRFS